MIQRHFKLALTAGHSLPLVINANQYDSGEQWLFTLYNDGVKYTPSTGAIVGIKADRLGIINTGTVDANGRVVINETRQMTAAVGKNIFELLIDDQTHGTANFMVLVEPRPGDNADLSESDYSLFEEAIQGTSQAAIIAGVQGWMDENLTDPTTPIVDASLTLAGAAADAKKTGDEISSLKSAISSSTGMSAEFKQALDALVRHIVYIGDDPTGETYINALYDAMYPPVDLSSISAVYTQSGTVYATDSLESLRNDLVVKAHYSDLSEETVTNYVLSGTLTVGTSPITVTYGGKTTTFTVNVSENWNIVEWDYTQGLPSVNSAFTKEQTGTVTETLQSNGVSYIVASGDGNSIKYGLTQSTQYSKVICEAVVTPTLLATTSGRGIKINIALGGNNSNKKNGRTFAFNSNGLQYYGKNGNTAAWKTISGVTITAGTKYTLRCEHTDSASDLYLNGAFVTTLTDFGEQIINSNIQFQNGGESLLESFRMRGE